MARSQSPDGEATLRPIVPTERERLIEVAREAVRIGLTERRQFVPRLADLPSRLAEPAATFVTLRRRQDLLGCIGSMEPIRSLAEDVARNATSAAFADPRLPSVTWTDYMEMSVKVSLLGPLVRLEVESLIELKATARPGIDGLLITHGQRRGTFLPSVWEQVPDPDQFLAMLWEKAGLPHGDWPDHIDVFRYETLEFGD